MKTNKLIIAVILVMAPFFSHAQSQFDKFEDIEGGYFCNRNAKSFLLDELDRSRV